MKLSQTNDLGQNKSNTKNDTYNKILVRNNKIWIHSSDPNKIFSQ